MQKWILELIIGVITLILITISVKIFGLETITIILLTTIISEYITKLIWKK